MKPFALLLADLRARLGWRLWALVALFGLTGLAEGASIAAILPLLAVLGVGGLDAAASSLGLLQAPLSLLGLRPEPGPVALCVAAIFAVSTLLLLTQARLSARLYAEYGAGWQTDLFDAFMQARWRFFVGARTGDLLNGLTAEVMRTSGAFHQFTLLAGSALTGLVYLGVALSLSWRVTLAIAGVGLILFKLTRPLVRRAYRMGSRISSANEELQAGAGQAIGTAKTIKAMGAEAQARADLGKAVAELRTGNFYALFDGQMVRASFEFGGMLALLLLLVVGIRWFGVDSAVVLVVIALFVRLFPRISALQQSLQSIAILAPSICTLRRLLDTARAEAEPVDPRPLPAPVAAGPVALELRGVTVAHAGEPVLREINLSVRAGEIIALVGSSGAGKSTLVDVILGLADSQSGQILVAGVPLADLPAVAWRRRVGYMAQEAPLFNGTVRENINWGRPGLGAADIVDAARRAALDSFVAGQAQGLDTQVGDRGSRLSGGERQRVALARALAGDPLLLVLDEATSALDAATEAQVIASVAALRGRVTVLMVAHRLAACRIADRVIVLEAGRIVDAGPPNKLLERPGQFRDLWRAQGSPAIRGETTEALDTRP
jgi:ATP-binding cassette subfamily C protein